MSAHRLVGGILVGLTFALAWVTLMLGATLGGY